MDGIYQHFRTEEYPFIDQVVSLAINVQDEYAPRLTHFLDPRQCFILQTVIGGYPQLKVDFFGGNDTTERKRAFIYPDYYTPAHADFDIALFQIRYPVKFSTLTHQHILGALLSLGIKRELFGDIMNFGEVWQFFVAAEMKQYIIGQLEKIGKVSVRLEEHDLTDALKVRLVWEEKVITLSSMRLDAVLASSHNLSRQKTKQLIQSGLVKVNWMIATNPDFECEEEDILSVRGYGRIKVRQINGRTKKDKIRVDICYLK
ncbi:RNA-binding protein [Listeria sp. PSOL-1]|uniref:YlmH family RNA-binding protein n=1 Tax=Listeria sp. PSOL-1 TaxID=1844999 RepID=UPI0018D96B9C|nr:RNA-binding protein [Listeria sp. PSOL-1]